MPRIYKPLSEETKLKMSLAHKGIVSPNKGKKLSKEWREKLSKSHKGINTWIKGTKQTKEHIAKKSPPTGSANWKWKGGVTTINEKIRKSPEYKLWRESVFKRDGYTCIWCKKVGGEIHADHIKRFSDFPELRFAIDNGRTLCKGCHLTTDTWGSRNKNI